NGRRYQERTGNAMSKSTEYVRLGFKEYKKQFDLSEFQFVRTDDSLYKNNERMLSIRQLNVSIDSIHTQTNNLKSQWSQSLLASFPFSKYMLMDSSWAVIDFKKDSLINREVKSFSEWLPDSLETDIAQMAKGEAMSV